ncbi:protein lethal(2)essential for life [Uranotaenia lowii]|uniref:protein lethal(2)essential for life n=1 Tax=Uranotaenia lowii TaxID=190385 RepID=UPI0024783397|nr:protein lethal(2)essential for life [Uranotaenia lowii]XP_055604535.1 protein lethal(2)essential for life [Uranotaenia lowii]
MSVVPMMFRDWWDDFDAPFRTRLLDQHFGTGLRADDLFSSLSLRNNTSPVLRSAYYRPWRNTALARQDSGSTLNLDKEKFQIILDVQQFSPEEVTVKINGRSIVVEGKHEEKQDEHGFVSRHFTRRYMLPDGHDPNDVLSTLSSDGVLTVTAPKKALPAPNPERSVPIQQTGTPAKEQSEVKIEQAK